MGVVSHSKAILVLINRPIRNRLITCVRGWCRVQVVLAHLEVIKESYRVFHTRSVGVCNRNPPIMDNNGNTYERALCGLLRLTFNCAPPLVEGACAHLPTA